MTWNGQVPVIERCDSMIDESAFVSTSIALKYRGYSISTAMNTIDTGDDSTYCISGITVGESFWATATCLKSVCKVSSCKVA